MEIDLITSSTQEDASSTTTSSVVEVERLAPMSTSPNQPEGLDATADVTLSGFNGFDRKNVNRTTPKRGGFNGGFKRGNFGGVPFRGRSRYGWSHSAPMGGPSPFFPIPPPMMPMGFRPSHPPMMPPFYGGNFYGTPQRPSDMKTPRGARGGMPGGRAMRASPARGSGLRRSRLSFDSPPISGSSNTGTSGNTSPREKNRDGEENVFWDAREEGTNVSNGVRPSKQFALATPTTDSRSSAPHRSLRTETGAVTYPLIYVSPAGTISIILSNDVIIETAVDRSVRVVCHNNFSAFINSKGTSSSILHQNARILHTKDTVYSKFISSNDKMAVFGLQGVLFTMGHLTEAYLVNMNLGGASAVALDQLQFPPLLNDYTLKLFYSEAQTGQQFIPLCKDIVDEARYDRKADGTLFMHINGMMIRSSPIGDIAVDARPRHITCSPSSGTVHVRSTCVDCGVQASEKAFVKCGTKRVHVSRSGMVVSDGNCITSMDHFGRIVSCA